MSILITAKLGLVLLLLIGFNALYTNYLWQDDLRKYDAHVLLDLKDKEDSCDAIYLGESSNFSYHPDDTQKLSISDLTAKASGLRIGSLNKGAYHAGIFLPLIKQISSESVTTIIVTLNLRTLNQATIHAPLETSLQKQARMFQPGPALWNRVMLTLNAYDDKSLAERDKAMWYEWTFDTLRSNEVSFPAPTIKTWCELSKFVDASGKEDMAKRTLADHYIKAYAFQIDTNTNPRIEQLDAIAKLCNERGYRLVFNLLAENVAYADSLVGEPLVWLMRANRDLLVNRYSSRGAIVVDNLEAVPGKHYTDQDWTTEHYDEVGRQIIANRLAQALRGTKKQ